MNPTPDKIDPQSDASLDEWAQKFDATHDQIKEAIDAVGPLATDVEMHLKGSRSITNADRVDEAGGAS